MTGLMIWSVFCIVATITILIALPISQKIQKEKQKEAAFRRIILDKDKFKGLKDVRNNLDLLHFKGCYVIRNTENNKIYVGQSKDIANRISQHFDINCKPLNHIFFEDYYNSKLKNKEYLFEVRFEACATKDELDSKEKELIERYNSFNYEYNGTRDNN